MSIGVKLLQVGSGLKMAAISSSVSSESMDAAEEGRGTGVKPMTKPGPSRYWLRVGNDFGTICAQIR